MQRRRPPGDGGRVAPHRKIIYAALTLVFFNQWLYLVDAQQQQQRAANGRVVSGSAAAVSAAVGGGGTVRGSLDLDLDRHLDDGGSDRRAAAAAAGDGRIVQKSPVEAPVDIVRNIGATPVVSSATHVAGKSTVSTGHAWDVDGNIDPKDSRRKAKAYPNANGKNRYSDRLVSDDASALATLAPEISVRAPNPPRPRLISSSVGSGGLASPQSARSLEDWEVEDFVLLATVDGNLYATDRSSGRVIWTVEHERPMVQVVHHRQNRSLLDDEYTSLESYIWAIEPVNDGELYIWVPGPGEAGLVKTDLTMKKLVESSPYESQTEPRLVYAGERKTSVLTLDAATGKVLKWFGSTDSHVNTNNEACASAPHGFTDSVDGGECSSGRGIITLGRVEYTVGIYHTGGQKLATLQYAEWSPNNFDNDLLQQYRRSLDGRYITSQHDGKVYGFDLTRADRASGGSPIFANKFSSPVARVFDVARPWSGASGGAGENPELVLLPQPALPAEDTKAAQMRSATIFLNQTEAGSWYAMSGKAYPLIVDAPRAVASSVEMHDLHDIWENMDDRQVARALVGMHFLSSASGMAGGPGRQMQPKLTLPDRESNYPPLGEGGDADDPMDPANPQPGVPVAENVDTEPRILQKVKSLPQQAAQSVVELFQNPILIVLLVVALFSNQSRLRRWYQTKFHHKFVEESESVVDEHPPEGAVAREVRPAAAEGDDLVAHAAHQDPAPVVDAPVGEGGDAQQQPGPGPERPEGPAVEGAPVAPVADGAPADGQDGGVVAETKKKNHRGRRGGVKHRKGNKKREGSQPLVDDEAAAHAATVDEVLDNTKRMAEPQRPLAPDIQTVSTDMQDVSMSVIKLGPNFTVDTNRELGIGSNGTTVYAGTFDGRDVAVKRMLVQFYEIASHETRLLRESDDHPNVIRYYTQYNQPPFLYIALELCQGTLSDVIERPHLYRDLAAAGAKDLPGVLYQITAGIGHLHGLRIVHRDLKPQNILVNLTKDGKPRLVVSDFGLCKKLDGGQSSFGATTAHAAGTAGWRAPELLLDDDARDRANSLGMAEASSTHSSSGGPADANGTGSRRATRAIDIFSLGLVFFYVLTKGSHPFDCGDRYMREVNIRKGSYNLDALEVLGDYAFEARDLIQSMLSADPRARPTAREVMAHPFFWSAKKRLAFLCDVSDHFEKEPREPPSSALSHLESFAPSVTRGDFLKLLPREFVDSLGKQRKYTGNRLLDLLRALRNKRNHYEDMPESLKKTVGSLPEGYLGFWTRKFPNLLIACWNIVYDVGWETTDRFKEYYEPAAL